MLEPFRPTIKKVTMARTTKVILTDDIDGPPADETVSFSLDGVSYEIDLTGDNAARLRDAFAPWVGAGRRTGGRTSRSGARKARTAASENTEIRNWAREAGHKVSDRGRIPTHLIEAYHAR